MPANFAGPPLVANGTVVTGGYRYDNGTVAVQAVARATGAVRWQRQFNAPLFTTSASVLSVAGGQVVVARPEAIVSLDLATGATLATVEDRARSRGSTT